MRQRANSGLVFALTSVLSMASMAAMSQDLSDGPAMAGAPGMRLSVISVAEDTFLKKAAQCNTVGIKLGQLAETRGSRDSVQELGRKMVKDHTEFNKKLEGLAKAKRVNWPSDMHYKHEAAYNRLSNMSGADFDRAFLQTLVDMHEKDIAMYREIAEYGSDAEIRLFARQRLPILRKHLRQIRSME